MPLRCMVANFGTESDIHSLQKERALCQCMYMCHVSCACAAIRPQLANERVPASL